jgi:hypothetical protein
VPEVDDDQLAALRRLRSAFGPIEVVEVISQDPAAAPDESMQGARMADPGRMTPEEREQAHALLTRALIDPNWRTTSQALDDLMRKLLVVHRLLEAEKRLAKRGDGPTGCNGSRPQALDLLNRSSSAGGFRLAPPAEPPALACRRPRARPGRWATR